MMSSSFWFVSLNSLSRASTSLSLPCDQVLTAPESAFRSCALSFGGWGFSGISRPRRSLPAATAASYALTPRSYRPRVATAFARALKRGRSVIMQTTAATAFVGDIPRYYDGDLGPILFEDYAHDIAARAAGKAPANVLELAAGTGIVSRKLRDTLPASAQLTVTDLNAAMLEIAKAKFRQGENVAFATADAAALAHANASFDLAVCQFGYMFLPDKQAGFREAHRVLKDGGRLLFNVWAPMEA